MLYRITIKRGAATITTFTLQTDDPDQAIRMARLDFDLNRRRSNATAVMLTDQDGRVAIATRSPSRHSSRAGGPLVPVSVNEAPAFPNLEAGADAWHVYPMGVLDSSLVIVVLGVDAVVDVIAVVDEMNLIASHARPPDRDPNAAALASVG